MNIKNRIKLINGDICTFDGDVIVNAANSSLLGGSGVDGAIHRAAGPKLLEECRKLNGCPTGEAKITLGYNLKAKNVIHTVGPVWRGGGMDEEKLLKKCYVNSLKLAVKKGLKTVAFPSISTGTYRFPFEKASKIAVKAVFEFLSKNESVEEVSFYCFSEYDFNTYNDILEDFFKSRKI